MSDPIAIIDIDSWDAFSDHLRGVVSAYGSAVFYYRGQSDPAWLLTPSLHRRFGSTPLANRSLYTDQRDGFLRTFRDFAHGVPGFPMGLTGLDQLITIGRHHGLATPVLDWTRSPFIAAFFALRDIAASPTINMPLESDPDRRRSVGVHGSGVIAVWRLQLHNQWIAELDAWLKIHTEVRFQNLRQKAQACVYTHLDTHEYLSIDELFIARGFARYVEKWVIKVDDVVEAIEDLDRMNIHIASLFPDLDHAAKQAHNLINYHT